MARADDLEVKVDIDMTKWNQLIEALHEFLDVVIEQYKPMLEWAEQFVGEPGTLILECSDCGGGWEAEGHCIAGHWSPDPLLQECPECGSGYWESVLYSTEGDD